jgi:hypothetical protein
MRNKQKRTPYLQNIILVFKPPTRILEKNNPVLDDVMIIFILS